VCKRSLLINSLCLSIIFFLLFCTLIVILIYRFQFWWEVKIKRFPADFQFRQLHNFFSKFLHSQNLFQNSRKFCSWEVFQFMHSPFMHSRKMLEDMEIMFSFVSLEIIFIHKIFTDTFLLGNLF